MMTPAERWEELETLYRLKALYFRLYDTRDWEGWLALFLPDATLTADFHLHDEPAVRQPLHLEGRDAIRNYILAVGDSRRTVHHGHTPEIDLLSPEEAAGIWAMEDIIDYPGTHLHGHGHYHERYRKRDGRWRFASIHLKRLRLVTHGKDTTPLSR